MLLLLGFWLVRQVKAHFDVDILDLVNLDLVIEVIMVRMGRRCLL